MNQDDTVRLKQTLDCRLPRVLGFLPGLIPRPASFRLARAIRAYAQGPADGAIQLKEWLC
jgi:hypothetical protein